MTLDLSIIWALAQKELRDALRNRWFLLYTTAFVLLALALSYLALAGSGIVGFVSFGRTAASLVNLVLLIVPLMALTIGAQSLASEWERGTLEYLLAQPISRLEVFLGKYLGLALSMLASLTLGFGISGILLVVARSGAADPIAYLKLVALAFLLSLAMLSAGFLISALTHRTSVAMGSGLFLWLVFVFLGDLGMMGTAMILRVPIQNLFWISLANPLQTFKMAAILDIKANLDVLGPAGIFAMQRYGDALLVIFLAVMALWVIIPTTLAYMRFSRRGDF